MTAGRRGAGSAPASPGAAAHGDAGSSGPVGGGTAGLVRLEVGAVAHGGHCVARLEGRVVFVRHALPGEVVRARLVTAEASDRFWRAEAVEVLEPSVDRVAPPCPVAGPGGCGGCDWQHASLAAQRRLKAEVVREQLVRLGGVADPRVEVEAVPGDVGGLGWRTRLRWAVDTQGRPGLRAWRSHRVVPVERCPLAHPCVDETGVSRLPWPGAASLEVIAPAAGRGGLLLVESDRAPRPGVLSALPSDVSVGWRPPGAGRGEDQSAFRQVRGRTWVEEEVEAAGVHRSFRVTGSGFWQVHPGAAGVLLQAVLDAADPRPGETALDLYCGVGLFAAGLAQRVGEAGTVVAVESEARAVADARRALHDLPTVRLETGRVERVLPRLGDLGRAGGGVDVVVLDPPRSGAGRAVLEQVVARDPRVVVYVACDPASLARDVSVLRRCGYGLAALRALDLFPMTHHVECVATFRRDADAGGGGSSSDPGILISR